MPEQLHQQHRKLRDVLTDPASFATTLLLVAMDIYGPEITSWSPETLKLEIRDDFNLEMSDELFSRLMAGVALLATDDFYNNLRDFIMLCNVLSGDSMSPEFDLADAEEIAWGITEAMLIFPPDEEDDAPFHPEIVAYIQEMLDREGIMNPPDILRIGLKDPTLWDQVQGDFSDDPVMFQAIYGAEQSKTEDINATLRERLRTMVGQIESLPLKHGDTSGVAKRMLAALQSRHGQRLEENPV